MKTIFKQFLFFTMLLVILFNFVGCASRLGIEEFAYVIAIGLDMLDDSNLELTLQFATASGGGSSDSSMQSTKINVSSVKCNSIDSGIALINSHVSKKINLSHCQEIIISEELARHGISEQLDTLVNNTELTNDAGIIISKCTAKEYIENVNPVFEGLLPQFYKASLKTNDYTAYSTNMNLANFYCLLNDSYFQPYATIGNILDNSKDNIKSESSDTSSEGSKNSSQQSSESGNQASSSESSNNTKSSSSESDNSEKNESSTKSKVPIQNSINANFIAGDYEVDDKNPIQTIGFAAFHDDKLVGEFTGLDSICFLIINNELEECTLSVPNPFKDGDYMDLYVASCQKTKCSVELSDSSTLIHVNIYLTGFGQSMDESISYGQDESVEKIEQSAENYLKESIENFLYKTSKEYNSDICGFGRFAVKHYLTMEDWEKVNWLNNYKNSTFDVNVYFNVKAGNIFSET